MNRIEAKFKELKKAGRKGLVGYLTAGDPGPAVSEQIIRAAVENGVDILELGVPFSDPTADGPTIQEAAQRALAAGMTPGGVLEMVQNLRRHTDVPIVLFGYANPFFVRGYARLCREAAEAGADGLLVVDLPFEESAELRTAAAGERLCFIPLIAPTTPPERGAAILKDARGFVYYIMVTGVTGAREALAEDVAAHVEGLRRMTDLPIAVGFGISNGRQARAVAAHADAVVVGSALVKAAHTGGLVELVRELRAALG
jgi:tryptophan synthase alpha chain